MYIYLNINKIDEIFHSSLEFAINLLLEGKGLFVKFWILDNSLLDIIPYEFSILPGIKEGISGSIIAGYNLGIDKNILPEKLEASIIAFKYLTTKEFKKKLSFIQNKLSGIDSLYEDEEVCEKIDCETVKKLQMTGRPLFKYYEYDDYNQKIINYIHQFLYKNQTASKVLEKIDDLTRIHFISITEDDNYKKEAIVIFMITIILLVLMLLSLLLLFFKNFNEKFDYMSKGSWIISIIGLIMILSSIFTFYGTINAIRCQLRFILIFIGNILNLIPIFYKFIIDFPESNRISEYFKIHKYFFFFFYFMSCLILIILNLSYKIKVVIILINDGQNYQECRIESIYGFIIVAITIIYYLLTITNVLILSYIEWNQESVMFDVRGMVYAIYSEILLVVMLFILELSSFNNYFFHFLIEISLLLILGTISFISIYGMRIFINFHKKKNKMMDMDYLMNDTFQKNIRISTNLDFETSETISRDNKKSSILLKIRNYHHRTTSFTFYSNNFTENSKDIL